MIFPTLYFLFGKINEWEFLREWASGKLVEYESLRVSNGRVGSSRLKNGQVASRYASTYWKISIFQCQIPCDYWNSRVQVRSSSKKIVECKLVMRICRYSPIPYARCSIYVSTCIVVKIREMVWTIPTSFFSIFDIQKIINSGKKCKE